MSTKSFTALFIVIALLAGDYLLISYRKIYSPTAVISTPAPTPMIISNTTDNSDLKTGGSSYLDPQGLYSFLYPNDYVLDTKDRKHIRIYKRVETQRPQSEMSDGILMVFESIDLNSQSLSQWVDSFIKESTMDGTNEMIEPKKSIVLNNFPGFTYELRGLGTTTYVVLQKNTQSFSAVMIAYAISDPEGKNYKVELDAILSTFQILK